MNRAMHIKNISHRLVLGARPASELMTPNVLTVCETTPIKEATVFLAAKAVSAIPVVNEVGEPVGVLSRADIVKYYGEEAEAGQDGTLVRDVMTQMMFSVEPDTPASTVVDAMISLGVHRLFVTDGEENVLGVVSALDILRHLCPTRRGPGRPVIEGASGEGTEDEVLTAPRDGKSHREE
jgi:CBS domain-containing protein